MAPRRPVLVVLALAQAACIEPTQYGGPIPVRQAGLAARLESYCRTSPVGIGCESFASARDDEGRDPGEADGGSSEVDALQRSPE